MQIGFHLTPFWAAGGRTPTQVIDDALEVVRAASRMGYGWVSLGHHFLSYPGVWPQPYPVIARLAPETGAMLIRTNVLLLPMLNAVEVAENVATLDHITHGRLVLGVGIGYREQELEAAGATRRDRAPKLEESMALMKRLWSGEEVTFAGRYVRVTGARLGITPFQKPYPPLEMSAQSLRATRRAARLTDGVFFGPQMAWADVGRLAEVYRQARREAGHAGMGVVAASRSLMVGSSKENATSRARQYLEHTFANYRRWAMQEPTMVQLQLDFDRALDDWTIHGSPRDCVEVIRRAEEEQGLTHLGLTIYSLPEGVQARIEYLQMIAEEIVRPARGDE